MNSPAPIVETGSGPVRGRWADEGGPATALFLGIPFAKPPIGERRFAAPEPPEPWTDVREATAFGPTPQVVDGGETIIPEPAIPGDDMLSVNIFTPAPGDEHAALPVVVYIHGGGYISGSPASPWYDGRAFARDGVVTVTLSYRLGFDGFGHVPGAPANRGVRDWLAALSWVQENIAAFGGDPGRVTIAGQSAGGGAVLLLLAMPAARGLFHGAWAMSPALSDVDPEHARTLAAKLAHLAGVPATREGLGRIPRAMMPELQHRATTPPVSGLLADARTRLIDGLAWGPTIDGDLVERATLDSLRGGAGGGIPLVIGTTDDEFTMITDGARRPLRLIPANLGLRVLGVDRSIRSAYLAANRAQRRKGTAALLGRYVTDAVFRAPVRRVAEAREHAPAPTWVSRFSWVSPTKGWACHCLDVPFWFDVLGADRVAAIAGDAPPRALAAAVHGSAASFIRSGDPGWTPWSQQPGTTRVFGGPASSPDVVADGYRSVAALG